ncbi:MAG TPA: hypothetical protein VNP36_10370 [Burkholderiales bacterium]|nr:hypothetical protein [Burkholderiales bacterium]
MKPELIAVAVVIFAMAAGVLLWQQKVDAPRGAVVEALAGPQPASEPPARGEAR